MRWGVGVVAGPEKVNVTGFFSQQARRRQPLHSSPDSLAHGPQEETFGKIRAVSLEHGNTMWIFLCVRVCKVRREKESTNSCL